MSGLDARFLFSETPAAHMHTIKVAIVDVSARSSELTPERFVDLFEARLDRMPVLRRRVVPVPHGLGNPVLVDDPDFDLRDHIRHERAAPPGEARELSEMVARIAAVPLPRDRPLWELTVVEGLAGEQVGFIIKIHHSLADGTVAVALLMNAFVADDAQANTQPFRLEAMPSNRDLYRMAVPSAARALGSIPSLGLETARGLRREWAVRRRESETVVGPFSGPRTPFNVALTPQRTFATLTLSIDALGAARHPEGASLNDAFLAVCGGGLRRYLSRTGDLPRKSLVASVPMATPSGEDRLSGNHVDNLFVPLHTEVDDPATRIRAIHASTSAARRVRSALGTGLFERRATLLPPLLYHAAARSWAATGLADRVRPPLNLVASCVRGPRTPLELDGGTITALYSSGPILEGIGLNITAWSYLDTMYVSLLGCPSSLSDPWRLAEDIASEMAALPPAV